MPVIELSLSGRPKSARVVGIDLGTTNSLVAHIGENGPEVIRDQSGNALVPSIVYYDHQQERLLVGEEARDRLITEPRKAIYSVKRFMGKGSADVQEDLGLVPFQIAPGSEHVIGFQMETASLRRPKSRHSYFAILKGALRSFSGRSFSSGHNRSRVFQ